MRSSEGGNLDSLLKMSGFVVVVFLMLISVGSVGGGMDMEYQMTTAQCVRWKDICV